MTVSKDALLPDPAQEVLLRSALATEDAAIADCFEQWLRLVPFDAYHDEGTYRLLPMVWSRLSQAGIGHPLLPRLKGLFRNSWVRSTQRIARASELLTLFDREGIATLVGKGLPLALDFYDAPALRPMNDIDIVVPLEAAQRASALLEREGFRSDRIRWSSECRLRHALLHRDPGGAEVDLHWHVLFDCPNRRADAHFWDNAVPFAVGEARTLRPSATDLLLQVVVHGLRPNAAPPVRWVADAAMIIRSGEGVDWQRLQAFAKEQRLAGRLALGLSYLRDRFGIDVPAATITALAARPSLFERFELMAMRAETGNPAWRHMRRGAHVVRLLRSDRRPWSLPLALAAEFHKRYLRTSPDRGRAAREARHAQ